MLKFIFMMLFMLSLVGFNMWFLCVGLFILVFMFMFISININMLNMVSMMFGIDLISLNLVLLSGWICGLMFMASVVIYKNNYFGEFFSFILLMLMLFLMLTFISLDFFFFFFFFESSMVPVLFLIVGWGIQPERIQAGIYLIFYTFFASLPMLLGIYFIYYNNYSVSFYILKEFDYLFLYLVMVVVFLIKMPMYLVHLWLPKAHVEASVSGSMILAGVMLKLGGYGLIRTLKFVYLINEKFEMNLFWMILSLLGAVYMSLICFRQIDMKSLIACSSVVHMSFVIGGLMTMNSLGVYGSVIMMVGHGLCSSGLFVLVNLMYERLSSRSMMINKGLLTIFPSLSFCWALFLFCNMASPPSLNLAGEIMLMISIGSWSCMMMVVLGLVSFLSAGYSLFIFMFSQHGKLVLGMYSVFSISSREFLLLFLHWLPLNLLILNLDYFLL
uniref:NADH-ubiquinone oxidoreductase chain 4 n=1 Tax=Maesaipsyche stengeli TaxID=2904894 RepID=A0A9E8LPQ4_9NEOP|nr:NADH dehydrogenase subunit 4 [Maesaipsyche stengeli]UZZ43657.1 NADH dehydrogenase subunit 4 [Maesaipsyche stengeli]